MAKKSLLLVGYPRGFTSESHRIASAMLPMLGKPGISAGEVLNADRNPAIVTRYEFYMGINHPNFNESYNFFEGVLDSFAEGHVIKDVTYPIHILEYISRNPNKFNVVYIHRNLDHVRYACYRKNWNYIDRINMYRLHYEFSKFPTINAEKAMRDPMAFEKIIKKIYPAAKSIDYITPAFIKKRDRFYEEYQANHKSIFAQFDKGWKRNHDELPTT
jgi:hypothetical protein